MALGLNTHEVEAGRLCASIFFVNNDAFLGISGLGATTKQTVVNAHTLTGRVFHQLQAIAYRYIHLTSYTVVRGLSGT